MKVKFAFKPYDLQQKIIDAVQGRITNAANEPYRFFVAALGRQSGKSALAKYLLMEEAINNGATCIWVALSIPNARAHWNDMKTMIEKSGLPVRRMAEASKEVHFMSGGVIYIRSAVAPDSLRGLSPDLVILDEAAYFPDGQYIWENIVQPMVTATRGRVLFLSTPAGRNWFYDLFLRGQDPLDLFYRSWTAPSSISPYQDLQLLEEIKKSVPERTWLEEYEAKFLQDSSGVFIGVERVSTQEMKLFPEENQIYVAGVDIGSLNDATAFTVFNRFTMQQVWGKRWQTRGLRASIAELTEAIELWQPEVLVFERNGLGNPYVDMLKEVPAVKAGYTRLRGIHIDNDYKRMGVEMLQADIEHQRIWLLNTDTEYGRQQAAEMSLFERKALKSGITFAARPGATDDTVSALYLARLALPRNVHIRPTVRDVTTENRTSPFRSKRYARSNGGPVSTPRKSRAYQTRGRSR